MMPQVVSLWKSHLGLAHQRHCDFLFARKNGYISIHVLPDELWENTSHLRQPTAQPKQFTSCHWHCAVSILPGLSMSFLTVQALRFAISGILPNQEGSHPRPGKTFRIFGSQKTGCCVESARLPRKWPKSFSSQKYVKKGAWEHGWAI